MRSITLKAPAKVNIFLKVLERRPDGYHKIETLFEKIALCDTIRLEKARRGISVYSCDKNLPEEKENLAYRAAGLLRKRCGASLGVRIEIEKRIPIGAGLGGGSSDAAAVLDGINRLYEMGLSKEELEALAAGLGADVPFFMKEEIWAVGRERGDSITGVESRLKVWHVLVVPSFFILSRDAYRWIDGAQRREAPDMDKTLSALRENDIEALGEGLHNDLEPLSLEREGALKDIKDRLAEYGAAGSLVSGSGPALFAIARNEKEVARIKEKVEVDMQVKEKNWQVLAASTLDDE